MKSLGPLAGAVAVLLLAPAAVGQSAALDPAVFANELFPVFEAAQCRACHARNGVASGSRLHFPEKDASAESIQAFGLSLARLVDRNDTSKSPLLNKPTNRTPHTGGERIVPGSPGEKLLAEWVRYLATTTPEALAAKRRELIGEEATGPDRLVRRLTHSQYDNTVRDLLGDYSRPAQRFPPEDFVDGFKNQLGAQGMPPLLVETYSTAAEKLALNAFRAGDINGLVPCKPTSAADAACRDRFIREFGLRAFRRPLSEREVQRYAGAFDAQAAAAGRFLEGARVVVEAMLQSPNFLFHVEAGPGGRFTGYDTASRLSYLLWNTMPGQALFDAAAKGQLDATAGRQEAARRMLDHPRAREALDQFIDEWLRFDRLLNATKQRRRYPEFSPDMAAAMAEETRRLLHYLVWEDRNFMELLTADYSFLSAELASLYGLPTPPGQFEKVKFPADSKRAGLLGHGSFLASTAGPTETSPTARGIFIREQLLCQHVPPPPPGVVTTLPEPSMDKPRTKRQLMTEHVENPSCAACHRLMDPIGFGLERFDAIGRWREKEALFIAMTGFAAEEDSKDPRKVELEIDTAGEIAGLPDSAFSESKRLGTILAESRVCQECIVRQMFRYAYGRLETSADQPVIDELLAKFKDSGFRFKTLLIALIESPEFLRQWGKMYQAAEPEPGPGESEPRP